MTDSAFIDTFPSVVAMTCDHVLHNEALFVGASISKQMILECESNLALMSLCEKYALVNHLSVYLNGTAALVDILLDLLPPESDQLPRLLVALHEYRLKFLSHTFTSSWFDKLRGTTNPEVKRTISLVSFHRPGVDIRPAFLEKILTVGFPCDSRETAREFITSIAATGEARMISFLCIGMIDWCIAQGFPAACDWEISRENMAQVWQTAGAVASQTPFEFSFSSGFLTISASSVVADIFADSPGEGQSICQDDSDGILITSLAGSHVSLPLLKLPRLDNVLKPAPILIDARSTAERDSDALMVDHAREEALDWYEEQQRLSPRNSLTEEKEFVILKFKKCLYVDEDFDGENAFITNLEFYRGNKLLIFGSNESRLRTILAKKEFPYVATVDGGFPALRAALGKFSFRDINSVAITGNAVRNNLAKVVSDDKFAAVTSWWKKTPKSNVSPTVVPAVLPTGHIVVAKPVTAMVDFEIGSSDDDTNLKSIDLSP